MKKIILSMLIVAFLATASSARVVVMKTIAIHDTGITMIILCINGYQYILTKYCYDGHHTLVQTFEEKDGRSVPVKCKYK